MAQMHILMPSKVSNRICWFEQVPGMPIRDLTVNILRESFNLKQESNSEPLVHLHGKQEAQGYIPIHVKHFSLEIIILFLCSFF